MTVMIVAMNSNDQITAKPKIVSASIRLLMPVSQGLKPVKESRPSFTAHSSSEFCAFDGDEPPEAVTLRQKLYNNHWKLLENQIGIILAKSNDDLLNQIVDFVSDSSSSLSSSKFQEIPTAALLAGINPTDHLQLYSHLSQRIKQKGHAMSTLMAANATSLKVVVQCMIQDLCGLDADVENDIAPAGSGQNKKCATIPDFSIQRLSEWYHHQQMLSTSDKLSSKLVVFIPEFEAFDSELLSKLLAICRERINTLPFVFIFGIATSIDCIHQVLSKTTICSLRLESFQLHRSLDCINDLSNMLQIGSGSGFRLGRWPYQQLLDNYHLHNLSVSAFIRGIQYSVMAFYYGNPLSVFHSLLHGESPINTETVPDWISSMHYLRLRMLPSFKRYVDEISETHSELAYSLLTDDAVLLEHAMYLINQLIKYQKYVKIAIEMVTDFQASFESTYLKRPIRTLIKDMLHDNLMKTDLLKTMANVHKNQPLSKIKATLLRIKQTVLDSADMDSALLLGLSDRAKPMLNPKKSADNLKDTPSIIDNINMLLDQAIRFEGSDSDSETVDATPDEEETIYLIKDGLKRIHKQKELERRSKVSTKLKPLQQELVLRDDTIASWAVAATKCIWDALTGMLGIYTSMPLFELFYFDDQNKSLSKIFNAQPRAVVQTALAHPDTYMPCDRCLDPSQTISSSLNDTSIVYALYLECGRLINLYDWHTAFSSIVQSGSACSTPTTDPLEIQVRFIKAVADLQHLGFIKPTMRKTDHVVRLTWGSD
ncbi:Origin recognition complex subunit 3 [Batrachochytrium dendrobatidis]|nr:Origin recognition complex subunit 3 [Batrachochytrium dendrobatidis]